MIPSYLFLSRHSIWYFRIVVPDIIRPLFPCKELRRSLQTRCKREALIRSRELLTQVQGLFTEAFKGRKPPLETLRGSWEAEGKRLASWVSWLRAPLHLSESAAACPAEGAAFGSPTAHSVPPVGAALSDSAGSSGESRAGQPVTTVAPEAASDALQARPVSVPVGQPSSASTASPRLTEVIEEHLAQQEREGVLLKTLDDKRAVGLLLVRIVGDLPINQYTRKDAHRFRETALRLPPRYNRFPVSKTLEAIIAEAKETISTTTFNNYVKNLTTFFTYAVREGYCQKNPFEGLRVRQRHKVSEERAAFNPEDLRKLFAVVSVNKNDRQPHRYWLPLLGLYTGARLSELCQLYLDDIATINGIDCIHIRAAKPDQRLKTASSERIVPIHSELKALGFLDYVEEKRAKADHLGFGFLQRLFPELARHAKHGYGAGPSKWFTRVREQLGFTEGPERKDFHSFRHTVADCLKQQGISESLVGGLLGHQSGGITFSRYGKDFRPEVLAPVVEMIPPPQM